MISVSNTLIIKMPTLDYVVTKGYLSNTTNNVLILSCNLGPCINGFYNAAISVNNGISTTVEYLTLQGFK